MYLLKNEQINLLKIKKSFKKAANYIFSKYFLNLIFFKKYKLPQHIIYLKPLVDNSISSITEYGITAFELEKILSYEDIKNVSAYASNLRSQKGQIYNKRYNTYFLGGNYSEGEKINVSSRNPFLKIALNPSILMIVNSYLKGKCNLVDIQFAESFPSNDSERKKSQRWHRDPAINNLIKVFVYFSDVNKDNGPFEFITGTHNKKIRDARYGPETTKKFGGSFYPEQSVIESFIDKEDPKILRFTGSYGSVIIADTSGFHRGGYCQKDSRLMLTLVYYPKIEPLKSRVKIEGSNNHFSSFQKSNLSLF